MQAPDHGICRLKGRLSIVTRKGAPLVVGALLLGCGGVTLVRLGKPHPQKCGVERWAVKTLSDPGASQVRFTPVPTTIAYLRKLPAPKTLPVTRLTAEQQTYTISGILQAWKLEADGDLHLALADSQGRTMIAEVPNPSCMKASKVIPQVRLARQAVITALGQPNAQRFQMVNRAVTVTGVFFLDVLHGQRNVAPNGAELHPVTRITFKP